MMPSPPSIRVSRLSPPASAAPMAIPRAREHAPPPLPPPTRIPEISTGQDPGWQWGNDPNGADFGRPASVKPGSSLLGGAAAAAKAMTRQGQEHGSTAQYPDGARRGSSISTVTHARDREMAGSNDDGVNSSRPTSKGLQSEKQLGRWTLEESSQSYDKQLLSRIGGPNTPTRGSLSHSSEGPLAPTDIERRNSSLRPLSVPDRRHASLDSPASSRWPSSGGVSPGFTGFWHDHGSETSRTASVHRASLTSEENSSQRGSYDHSMFGHDDFEDGQMGGLNLHDRSPRSPKAGSKRRASSPPREREDRSSVSSAPGHAEIYHRRSIQQLPNRSCSTSRFHPNHSSLSSASSSGPRNGSLGSSLGVPSVPSSATSYTSGGVSPRSPAVDTDARLKAANPSPKLSQHQRMLSESTQSTSRNAPPESAPHSRNGSLGIYLCECCPKKPKKFDTEEELRLHESEKQYMCNYCPNRFKNKNEAERHQNSLHLRRHSWCCAALAGIESAFHPSSSNNADVCGYCGEEFPNPPQWALRADHLNHIHKFGECNQAKKFFRADHFRQHLKHSHQGTSGKWTNMLENACMKDEPPPEKRMSPVAVVSGTAGGQQPPPSLLVTTSGLTTGSSGPSGPGNAS